MRTIGLVVAGLIAAGASAQAQSGAVPFDNRWQLRGDSVRVEQFDGRTTLAMKNGFAYLRDARLENGTIDVDVMTTEMRSFIYVLFRMQSDSAYEDFYMRPHKSDAPDALQYAPVYQQSSAWQLYHGANGTASVPIPDGVWNHLRIVLSGRRAAIFLNDTLKPAMVIPRLGHEPRAGYLALRAFRPAGVSGSGPTVRFANLRVRPDHVPFTFPTADPSLSLGMTTGIVRYWQVSESFAASDSTPTSVPAVKSWRTVEALPNGLLELDRVVPLPPNTRNAGVVARLNIVAERAGVFPMELGFSDKVTAIVNGTPLFHANDAYDYAGRRDGLMAYSQATVYLPLRAGANTLELIVTDVFGGWGLMGRFPSMAGLQVR